MKTRGAKLICGLAISSSFLSTAIGYGLMADTGLSSAVRMGLGFIMMVSPVMVVQLVILYFKK